MPSLWSVTGRVPLWMTHIVMIGIYMWLFFFFFTGRLFLVLRVKESTGWQQVFTSPRLDWVIDRVALNAKVMGGSLGDNDKMVAVASGTEIILWAICPDGNGSEIGKLSFHIMLLDLSQKFGNQSPCLFWPAGVFSLNVPVEALFFVGNQLIATSHTGKVGVWNAVTKHWQVTRADRCMTVWDSFLHLFRCHIWNEIDFLISKQVEVFTSWFLHLSLCRTRMWFLSTVMTLPDHSSFWDAIMDLFTI